MNRIAKILGVVAIACVALVPLGIRVARDVEAASRPTPFLHDMPVSFKGSIATTTAIMSTQVAADTKIVIRALLLNASSASGITITNGSGGATKYNCYLEANKPFLITPEMLGGGLEFSDNTAPYAVADTGTGTLTAGILYNVK